MQAVPVLGVFRKSNKPPASRSCLCPQLEMLGILNKLLLNNRSGNACFYCKNMTCRFGTSSLSLEEKICLGNSS